jgi:putative acetyltransferase
MASLSELLGGVFEGLANVFERRFARSERRRNRDTEPKVRVAIEDPATPAIRELLEEHLREMRSITRADRVFALDVDALRKPDVAFFAARRDGVLVGCGALKTLDATHGEIKSMRTAPAARRSGVAFAVLDRIVEDARARGLKRLSLETGAARPFHGARKLYSGYGFV